MRKRIYQIIEVASDNDILSKVYDVFMMCVIFASLAPLVTKENIPAFSVIDTVTVLIFAIDYITLLNKN